MKMKSFLPFILVVLTLAACSTKENRKSNLPSEINAGPGEELAKGHVFHDSNENRIMDGGEKGIAGVIVSNGTKLVQI
jgi:hypothetical protein